MILVDSSIWIDHLRQRNEAVATLLNASRLFMHPFVLAEIALGHLAGRAQALRSFSRLPSAPVARQSEIVPFIEQHALIGCGIGFVDVHLLASALLMPGSRLWTNDRRLALAASSIGIQYPL